MRALNSTEIAAARVDQQSNLLPGDGGLHCEKRPHQLQRRDRFLSAGWRKREHVRPIINGETLARQHVKPDDGIDMYTFEIGEIVDACPYGTRLQGAEAEAIQNRTLDLHALTERDERG